MSAGDQILHLPRALCRHAGLPVHAGPRGLSPALLSSCCQVGVVEVERKIHCARPLQEPEGVYRELEKNDIWIFLNDGHRNLALPA